MTQITPEILALAAQDGILFSSLWFPHVARCEPSEIHPLMWSSLNNSAWRYLGLMVHRDGAKTSIVRLNIMQRISFRFNRTFLIYGANEDNAGKSLEWIKTEVEQNTSWSNMFGVRRGSIWNETEARIYVGAPGERPYEIALVAKGILSKARGINIQSYRPDYIVLDDVNDEENTNTPEYRDKINKKVFNAILPSLCPRSENKHAKLVIPQTLVNRGDLIDKVQGMSAFKVIRFPILNEKGESTWPARYSTEDVNQMKTLLFEAGRLEGWNREYMCRLVDKTTAKIRYDRIHIFDNKRRDFKKVFVSIDPAGVEGGKHSEAARRRICLQAVVCIGVTDTDAFVLECEAEKDMNPEQTWNIVNSMLQTHGGTTIISEGAGYQKTLAWYFKTRMMETKNFYTIQTPTPMENKIKRIENTLQALINNRSLHVHSSLTDLLEDLSDIDHVEYLDRLDALTFGLQHEGPQVAGVVTSIEELVKKERKMYGKLPDYRYWK